MSYIMVFAGMGNEIKSGAAWLFAGNFAARLLNLAAMVVLARLLVPDDFGLFALATVSWELLSVFFAGGINIVIIQARGKPDEFYDTAFLIGQALNILLITATFLAAPLAASYYSSQSLPHVLYLLALSYGITGLSQVQLATLTRDLKFNVISIINLAGQAGESLLMIVMAAAGAGYWSLVVPKLVMAGPVTVAYWRTSRWRPRLRLSQSHAAEIIRLSYKLLLNNILIYLNMNSDYIFVGRMLGQVQLGFYRFAFNLAQWPIANVIYQVNNLSLPYFSGIRDDAAFSRQQYLKMVRTVSLTLFPVFIGAALIAPQAFPLVFGEKWLPAIPAFQLICLLGLFRTIGSPGGQIFFAYGRPGTPLVFNLVLLPFLLGGLWLGAFYGITGVALASLIVLGIASVVFIGMVMRLLGVPVAGMLSALRPACLGSAMTAAAAEGMLFLPVAPWLQVIAAVAAGAIGYVLALALQPVAGREYYELISSTLRRLRK